jgi:hypothetical protein
MDLILFGIALAVLFGIWVLVSGFLLSGLVMIRSIGSKGSEARWTCNAFRDAGLAFNVSDIGTHDAKDSIKGV